MKEGYTVENSGRNMNFSRIMEVKNYISINKVSMYVWNKGGKNIEPDNQTVGFWKIKSKVK